jgi:hypothetical protein
MNTCAVCFPILESYQVVERQIKWMNGLKNFESWEVVFVDDGSDPPIVPKTKSEFNLTFITTKDFRTWTQAKAVNIGMDASADSKYVWGFAIDHFISQESVNFINKFNGDKAAFPRKFAILDENGSIQTDHVTLLNYGLQEIHKPHSQYGYQTGAGPGIQLLLRKHWNLLNGYDIIKHDAKYGGDDVDINHRYRDLLVLKGKATRHTNGPHIYVYPNAAWDAKHSFHKLRFPNRCPYCLRNRPTQRCLEQHTVARRHSWNP